MRWPLIRRALRVFSSPALAPDSIPGSREIWDEKWNFTASLTGTPTTRSDGSHIFPPGSIKAGQVTAGKGKVLSVSPPFTSDGWWKKWGSSPIQSNLLDSRAAANKPDFCTQFAYTMYSVEVAGPKEEFASKAAELFLGMWKPKGFEFEQMKDIGSKLLSNESIEQYINGPENKSEIAIYLGIGADGSSAVGVYDLPKAYDIATDWSAGQPNPLANDTSVQFFGDWLSVDLNGKKENTNNVSSLNGASSFEKFDPP